MTIFEQLLFLLLLLLLLPLAIITVWLLFLDRWQRAPRRLDEDIRGIEPAHGDLSVDFYCQAQQESGIQPGKSLLVMTGRTSSSRSARTVQLQTTHPCDCLLTAMIILLIIPFAFDQHLSWYLLSVDSGAIAQRSVHPASPVLLTKLVLGAPAFNSERKFAKDE